MEGDREERDACSSDITVNLWFSAMRAQLDYPSKDKHFRITFSN